MTKFSSIKFDSKDAIKLIGAIGFLACMWYDLRTEFQVFKATTELRLEALERKEYPAQQTVYKNREGIIPHEIKIEDENQ